MSWCGRSRGKDSRAMLRIQREHSKGLLGKRERARELWTCYTCTGMKAEVTDLQCSCTYRMAELTQEVWTDFTQSVRPKRDEAKLGLRGAMKVITETGRSLHQSQTCRQQSLGARQLKKCTARLWPEP